MSELDVTQTEETNVDVSSEESVPVIETRTPIDETETSSPADAWKPEYKFKVMDKEYEIDEFIRPAITKDTFDKVKDLYTKAYGLDHEKARAERYRGEVERLTPYEQQLQQQNKTLGYMGNLIQNKDYLTLFKELKIPDEELVSYSLERLKYRELPPEQRQEQDRVYSERNRLRVLELQNQEYSQKLQATSTQARAQELDSFVSGQAKTFSEEFDSKVGRPGAFRDEVIRRGQMAYYTQNRDLSVQEAANEVIKGYGLSGQSQGQATTMNTANVQSQQTQRPYIPNIRGSNMSPVRKQYSSVTDLKKKYDEMYGEQ